ncbi:hypothetical protein JTB14_027500 [Gonioctena quinquepunctata]|nr:hypothetical protein JTB14_027500 [Gonioctena quinquepunctata]
MERRPIRLLRIEFLEGMCQYREEDCPIIYTDETYIHSSHSHGKGWNVETLEDSQKPDGKNGFVPNAYIRLKANSTSSDYLDDMNFENYQKWISKKRFSNLQPKSEIDNARNHENQLETSPTNGGNARIIDNEIIKPQLHSLPKAIDQGTKDMK